MLFLAELIVIEGVGADEHSLVEAGGMEKVELAVEPKGEADMACVEAVAVGEHGYDVARADCGEGAAGGAVELALGYVAVALSFGGCFEVADDVGEVWVQAELAVGSRVG